MTGLRENPAGFATWLLSAILIVYLSLKAGGYDAIPREEIGIVVCWAVLLAVGIGAVSIARITPAAKAALYGLLALVAWTALSLGWTESAERTMTELARAVVYLGVFVLALAVQRGRRWRALLWGVTTGIAVVGLLGVLSRLHPDWFPPNELGRVLQGIEIERRLAYPLNYSSALGSFAAMSVPLLVAGAWSARSLPAQVLSAAALPIAGLAFYLSSSGTATVVVVAGVIAFFLLAPDRLPKLGTLAAGAAGTAILGYAVDQRAALDRGLPTPAAKSQGDEVLLLLVVVCLGVALCQLGLSLAVRYGRRPLWMVVSRRGAIAAATLAVLLAIPVAVAAGGVGEAKDRWDNFKDREGGSPTTASRSSQILNTSGSGRYQFWESAVDAYETEPLLGIGPGTYEFWWARKGLYAGFTRDAHSLYIEALGELGLVGFFLTTGLVLAVLLIGAMRAMRAPPDLRLGLAAATASAVGFAVAAGVDFMWEIAVMAIAFFMLAAVILDAGRIRRRWSDAREMRRTELGWRLGVVVGAIAAMVIMALPLRMHTELRSSERAVDEGRLDAALADARSAADAEPYAASPRLQEALVLERHGKYRQAAVAARQATAKESTNWRTWLVLSRIEAEGGDARASLDAYRRARQLNRRSGVLAA